MSAALELLVVAGCICLGVKLAMIGLKVLGLHKPRVPMGRRSYPSHDYLWLDADLYTPSVKSPHEGIRLITKIPEELKDRDRIQKV